MSAGLTEQINRHRISRNGRCEPSRRYIKTIKRRKERRRAKKDPECVNCYRKYNYWEY